MEVYMVIFLIMRIFKLIFYTLLFCIILLLCLEKNYKTAFYLSRDISTVQLLIILVKYFE